MKPTPEQQAVIDAQTGVVLVLAAVGSGKTSTLSLRIAAALARGVEPQRILALTFTNRAAGHLRESLVRAVGEPAARKVVTSTFHALCALILRQDGPSVGLPRDFHIADEEDTAELLRELGEREPAATLFALQAHASATPLGAATPALWTSGGFSEHPLAARYTAALADRAALDFGGLVFLCRALFNTDPAAAERWGQRFDVVLVDEVQDTHLSEYEVLRALAAQAGSFCLVGDLDQTIYGWRGSAPKALLAALRADFGEVTELHLTLSFRCSPAILALADRLAAAMPDRRSTVRAPADRPAGEEPRLSALPTADEEHREIARLAAASIEGGRSPEQIAVLVRTHLLIADLIAAFARAGVPSATLETFQFFRRAEVKDALCLLRLIVDPNDEAAARRVARRLVQGLSADKVDAITRAAAPLGLRLGDLLDPNSVAAMDPFGPLLSPDLIVLDTETTGLDPRADEVIEVCAIRVRQGQPDLAGSFHALLRPTRPLGDSVKVHGITEARLTAEGRDAAEVMDALQAFCGELPVAGHNIRFDLRMLAAHGRRLGRDLRLRRGYDTLPLARRLLRSPNHKLGTLIAALNIPFVPTHRATDDVRATIALAEALAARASEQAPARRGFLLQHAPTLARLRAALSQWGALDLRPADLLDVLIDKLLRHKYPGEAERLTHLAELSRRMRLADDPALPAQAALERFLDQAALSRDGDPLDGKPGVRVLTMHQSKGLEFDEVFVPGLVEGGMPSYRSLQEGGEAAIEEERRLLYVAITRARERLYLSWSERNRWGRPAPPSRFLQELKA